MNSKLTLSVDGDLIRKAKAYASEQGRSVSDMVESYLKAVTSEKGDAPAEISPLVQSLKGSFNAPDDFDYKDALNKALQEKHRQDETGTS